MNGMTHEVKQLREMPGLMACVLTHKVAETSAQYKWTGPKLNDEWPAILSFFDWTYKTMRSESQVRLFVNDRTKVWKAWAFPQKARTGMTAHEINESDGENYKKTKEQRAMFSDTEGWHYYGTVHHHCACGAFQSGPDTENERDQDGIHITVGNMDRDLHDIHFRIYQNKLKLTSVKPIEFWDVGNILQSIPDKMRLLLKPDWLDTMVMIQMGSSCPGAAFPDIWKDNVIDCTPKVVAVSTPSGGVSYSSPHGFQGNGPNYHNMRKLFTDRSHPNLEADLKKARWELGGFLKSPHTRMVKFDQVLDKLELIHMQCDDDDYNILDICCRNDVMPEKLYEYIVRINNEELAQAEARIKAIAEGGDLSQEGTKKSKKAEKAQQAQQTQKEEIDQQGRLHWSHPDFVGYPNNGGQLPHGGHEGMGSGA